MTQIDFVKLPSGLLMSRTPITQAQWREVMGTDPSYFKGDDLPVECVSWHDAMKFCRRTGTRLPTEAEWEYAYRAGTTTAWYNGDDESKLGEIAWFIGNSDRMTHPVAQKLPNGFGLYDMAGNVWEWCADKKTPHRAIRGGSWLSGASDTRAASRSNYDPGYRNYYFGFRVVKEGCAGMIDNNRWKHPLAQSVSRMVWAFAPDDDRRDEVRLMADQVNRLEEELEVLQKFRQQVKNGGPGKYSDIVSDGGMDPRG